MYRSTESYLDFGILYRSFFSGCDEMPMSVQAYLQSPFLFRSVVHTRGNDIPPSVDIGKQASERRTCRGESELTSAI